MSKATKLDFTTIKNSYNNNLDRSEGKDISITDNTGLFREGAIDAADYSNEVNKKVSGQDLDNLWIRSWIKSRNFKPKVSGFKLDGKTGKIECTGLDVWGGTITGAVFQTSEAGSGERIKIYEDTFMAIDENNILRVASDNGKWLFWDSDGLACGGLYGAISENLFLASFGTLTLAANSGTDVINFLGDIEPDSDATYNLGSRPYKWKGAYLHSKLRFDYETLSSISQITDGDISYKRIDFGANGGSISFYRNVDLNSVYYIENLADPIDPQDASTKKYVDDTIPTLAANKALSNLASVAINTALLPAGAYSLGDSTHRWNTLRLDSNIYFYGTASKGLIWDSAGDNAQIYYNNSSNYFVVTKELYGSSLSLTGNIAINGTVDGIDVSSHAASANSHHAQSHSHGSHSGIGASDHHSSTSTNLTIRPTSVYVGNSTKYISYDSDGFQINHNFHPDNAGNYRIGTVAKHFYAMHATNYLGCPVKTVKSALNIFRKIKEPKIKEGKEYHQGKGLYFLNDEFPDEMKVIDKDSKKAEPELGTMIGVMVNAIKELTQTVDDLTNRLNKLEKI